MKLSDKLKFFNIYWFDPNIETKEYQGYVAELRKFQTKKLITENNPDKAVSFFNQNKK